MSPSKIVDFIRMRISLTRFKSRWTEESYISVGSMSGIKYLQSSASVLAKTTFLDVFSSNLLWVDMETLT